MVLHLLYGQQQLQDCLNLLSAHDTLLLMDASVLECASESLSNLPCKVMLLDESDSHRAGNDGIGVIDTTGWLELVSHYSHSMSWA
jgi:sulfur transfer complex TusBCD TusB component (DsrH family)